MQIVNVLQDIAVWALPTLFAITVHEVAHGWVARRLGDPTAEMLGRLTLNPVKHIDPMGTVVIPLVLLVFGGFVFGWAKPVPVAADNLRDPRRDMAFVAAAGPLANLVMALLWALVMKVGVMLGTTQLTWLGTSMVYMGFAGISINLVLMVLNLLPVPPLDGGRVLTGVLPDRMAWQLAKIEPYGFMIVFALLLTGLLGRVLGPIVYGLRSLLMGLFGI